MSPKIKRFVIWTNFDNLIRLLKLNQTTHFAERFCKSTWLKAPFSKHSGRLKPIVVLIKLCVNIVKFCLVLITNCHYFYLECRDEEINPVNPDSLSYSVLTNHKVSLEGNHSGSPGSRPTKSPRKCLWKFWSQIPWSDPETKESYKEIVDIFMLMVWIKLTSI